MNGGYATFKINELQSTVEQLQAKNKELKEAIEDVMSNKKCNAPTKSSSGCKYRHQSDGCICCDCILGRLEQALQEEK